MSKQFLDLNGLTTYDELIKDYIDDHGGGGGGTDTKVTQTETTADGNYEVLLSGTADYETRTEGANKSISFRFNPNNKGVMEGISSTASGQASHAEGYMSQATGDYSHAEGFSSIAAGHRSHAEGSAAYASGNYSHAECGGSTASGEFAHAEGVLTLASTVGAHSEGTNTVASGMYSHAEGYKSTASGSYSHSEGKQTKASGDSSHAEGYFSRASGNYSHAEGFNTTASAAYGHAEGAMSLASTTSAHAEGNTTTASGTAAHSEGNSTLASGEYSHAEGYQTTSSGTRASHSEGDQTIASGFASHAEGNTTLAQGTNSHVEGYNTTATHKSQHVFGEYNLVDASTESASDRGNYIEVVGNGYVDETDPENPTTVYQNARTLDWDGQEYLHGNLVVHGAFANAHGRKGLEVEQGGASINGATEIIGNTTVSGALRSIGSTGIRHISNNVSGLIAQTLGYARSTHSKNQITTATSPGQIAIKDKNDEHLTYISAYMGTNGSIHSRYYTYNTSTAGTQLANFLNIGVAKNGDPLYTVPNTAAKTAFREAIGAAASSSQDYKENIELITEEEAKKILDIPVYSYDYKENFGGEKNQYGMIAEELVEKIPSAVNIPPHYENFDPELGDDQPLITIDYWKLIPHMVKVIQMQQKEIDELKKKIK